MKIIRRLLTALFIILATCSILNIYTISNQHNDTVGSLGNFDYYSDFDIFVLEEEPVFYLEDGVYTHTSNYQTAVDFDGTNNEYNLLVNDKPCSVVKSTAGKLYGEYTLSFNDLDNNEITNFTLKIEYKFYVSHIELSISAEMTEEQLKLLNEYLAANGFELRVIENVYYGGNEEELSKVYVNFYDTEENLITTYSTGYNSVIINDYTSIMPEDTETQYCVGWALQGSTELVDLSTYKFTETSSLVPVYENKSKVTYSCQSNTDIFDYSKVEYYKPGQLFNVSELVAPSIEYYTLDFIFGYANGVSYRVYPGDTYSFEIKAGNDYDIQFHYLYDAYTVNFTYYQAGKYESIPKEFSTEEEIIEFANNAGCYDSYKQLEFLGWAISDSNQIVDISTYHFEKGKIISLDAIYNDKVIVSYMVTTSPISSSVVYSEYYSIGDTISYNEELEQYYARENYSFSYVWSGSATIDGSSKSLVLNKNYENKYSFIIEDYDNDIIYLSASDTYNGYSFDFYYNTEDGSEVRAVIQALTMEEIISQVPTTVAPDGKTFVGWRFQVSSTIIDLETYEFVAGGGKSYTLVPVYEDIVS